MTEERKKVAKRCAVCGTKLGYISWDCRCNKIFCSLHRYPEEHACSFDHSAFEKQKLANTLMNIPPQQKVSKI